jgi:hypothetical protein
MNANESAGKHEPTKFELTCPCAQCGEHVPTTRIETGFAGEFQMLCVKCLDRGLRRVRASIPAPAPPLVPATEGPEPTQVGHVWNKQRGICSCGEWCRDQAERNYHLVQVYPASELVTYQQRVVSGTEGPLRDTLENLAMEWEQSLVVRHECPPETAQGVEYWHKRLKDYQLKCASELRAALAAHPK